MILTYYSSFKTRDGNEMYDCHFIEDLTDKKVLQVYVPHDKIKNPDNMISGSICKITYGCSPSGRAYVQCLDISDEVISNIEF